MVLARRSTGTWATPVGFYAGTFLLVVLAQEAMLPDLPFSAPMAGLILGSVFALFVGMLVTWRRPAELVDPPPLPNTRRAGRTVGLCAAFGVALFYLYQLQEVRSTGLGTSDSGLFMRAEFFALGGQTLFLRALQALTYCGALYVTFESRRRKRPALIIGGYLLIVLAHGVVFSSKLPVLICTLLVIAVVGAGHPTRFARIDRRVLAGGVSALLMLVLTFQIVTAVRHKGAADASAVMAYAILGPPSAYSLVLDKKAPLQVDPRWGMNFAGLRDVVVGGGEARQFGIYAQSVQLDAFKPESATNIYTWFVPLRHDFGLLGVFIVIFGLGLAAGALTTRQLAGSLGVFGQTVLALLNLELMFAPIFTVTYYNFFWLLLAAGVPLAWLYAERKPRRGQAARTRPRIPRESARRVGRGPTAVRPTASEST
jgi:oligosaccharide repeat unit polymerase